MALRNAPQRSAVSLVAASVLRCCQTLVKLNKSNHLLRPANPAIKFTACWAVVLRVVTMPVLIFNLF